MDLIEKELESIIKNRKIATVFQPIISLRDARIHGHEALSRIKGESIIKTADSLFRNAEKYSRLWEIEILCRSVALETAFSKLKPPYDKKLFLNVSPKVLSDKKFQTGFTKEFLKQFNIEPSQLVFEITERSVIEDCREFYEIIRHYRGQEFYIAIDDVGAGYSGLNLISEVSPEYIKLDMNLIRKIHENSLKTALVKAMVELSNISRIMLIAEGIETEEELETLIYLGVQYGQGYYIQYPQEEITPIADKVKKKIQELNQKKNHVFQKLITNIYVSNLCSYTQEVEPNTTVEEVYNIFKENSTLSGVCVVSKGIPVGIIMKSQLAVNLSGQFGFSLYKSKAIASLMDQDFLSVESTTPVNIVSSLAMSRQSEKLYDFIVVTKEDQYLGTVTVKDLLQKTTEIEVSDAKNRNPLTGLPGNCLIESQLCSSIQESNYCIAYIDIDNFKAYNDSYGFEKGDLIIKLVADILRYKVSKEEFLGHVGGDDFVAVFKSIPSKKFFEEIREEFEEEVLRFYSMEDVNQGYLQTMNRNGTMDRIPLMSITIVNTTNIEQEYSSVFQVTEELARLKVLEKRRKRIVK